MVMTHQKKFRDADCRCTYGKECVDVTVKHSVHRHQKDQRAYSTLCGSAAQGHAALPKQSENSSGMACTDGSLAT